MNFSPTALKFHLFHIELLFILLAEIKMQNMRAVGFSFIWALTENCSPGEAFQRTLRNWSEGVWGGDFGEVVMGVDFGEGVCAIKHTSQWRVAASHEEQPSQLMILVLFSEWEDARQWVLKIFSREFLIIWRPVLPVSSLSWTSFRLCWISATKVANDSVLVELGDEAPSLVGNALVFFWILVDQALTTPVMGCLSY